MTRARRASSARILRLRTRRSSSVRSSDVNVSAIWRDSVPVLHQSVQATRRSMARSRRAATSARTPAAAPVAGTGISAARAFLLNACFVAGLLVLSQLSLLQERPVVRASVVAAALVLLAWSGLLFGVLRRGQRVSLEIVPPRQPYLQACQQGAVILYWGYYWREVYHAAPLIAAQLLFAYGFDSLLSWTHRRKFALGFGPFPIIFSITLFLWFKDDWFYLQFAMVALGFVVKEFLRWARDGRRDVF